MFLVDYHTHPYGHGEQEIRGKYSYGYLKEFLLMAEEKGIAQLGFTDHDDYIGAISWDILEELSAEYPDKIRLGIEFDYKINNEEWIKQVKNRLPLDYSIGSVHRVGNWEIDHPAYVSEYKEWDIDELYIAYFDLVEKAVSSGLFEIIGHMDLIKIFNNRPVDLNLLEIVEPVLQAIKENRTVIEINTNGCNKPVNEFYPSTDILKRAYELKIPITIGSDAHSPSRVGEGIKRAASLAQKIGYKEITIFKNGKNHSVPF
ncbi:MAG: histidinol-phosphatase HisJ family protein [Firmicutes bacterium]|nr:histidinol-phosphatase HisJ family protein [Bacillota bacterium]